MSYEIKEEFSVILNTVRQNLINRGVPEKEAKSLLELAEAMWPRVSREELDTHINLLIDSRGVGVRY